MEKVEISRLNEGQKFRTAISGKHGIVKTNAPDGVCVIVDLEGKGIKALHPNVLVYPVEG